MLDVSANAPAEGTAPSEIPLLTDVVPSGVSDWRRATTRIAELEQEAADLRRDAARYRWLCKALSEADENGFTEFTDGIGHNPLMTVECQTLWGHRTTRAVKAELTWQEFREGPLDLSSSIDEQLAREADAREHAA